MLVPVILFGTCGNLGRDHILGHFLGD